MKLFSQADFVATATQLQQLPAAGLPEIAFAGRSNVGKSSDINALVNRRRLAFVSKTPGRTQALNFFDLGGKARLVDLPGYGFAKVSKDLRSQWEHLVGGYLAERRSLLGIVLVMDARHPFTALDLQLIDWLKPHGLPVLVLLAKADKLTRAERVAAASQARHRLLHAEAQFFSSRTREGVEKARATLENWLARSENKKPPAKGI